MRTGRRAFSLLELLVSISIIAVLLSLLLPVLVQARREAARALCMNNVRQIGIGWHAYLGDQGVFPGAELEPHWRYAGVRFLGGSVERPVADEARPLTEYLHSSTDQNPGGAGVATMYHCPEDTGLATVGTSTRPSVSVLQGRSCYQAYGNSYRANELLLDASLSNTDKQPRPLREAEVVTAPSRLVLFGDPVWFYATQSARGEQPLDASWHGGRAMGHVTTLDGTVRYMSFVDGTLGSLTVQPR